MRFNRVLEGVACLSLNELQPANLYFSDAMRLNDENNKFTENQKKFIDNIDDILLQNKVDVLTRWTFECLLTNFKIKENCQSKQSDFNIDLTIHEFEKKTKKDKLLKTLKMFIIDHSIEIPRIQSDRTAAEFSKEILYPILDEIDDQRLFKSIGYSSFSLFPESPPKFFWNIHLFTTNEQYKEVIYYTQDFNFIRKLQLDFLSEFQYPKEFPSSLNFNGSTCSLSFASLSKGIHFIDLLSFLFKDRIEHFDTESIPFICRVTPAFVPFFIAAYQPLIYKLPRTFFRLIAADFPMINNQSNNFCYVNNNISEMIKNLNQRFVNDFLLAQLLIEISFDIQPESPKKRFKRLKKKKERSYSESASFISNLNRPMDEIFQSGHSIPFLFIPHLTNDRLFGFNSKQFFTFSDEDCETDFDFIFSYNAIINSLNFLTSGDSFSLIEKSLNSITNHNQLLKTTTDIFSLLFLTKPNSNEFLYANSTYSLHLLNLLKKIAPSNRYIQYASLIFDSKFLSIQSGIINMLESINRKDWNIANDIKTFLTNKDDKQTEIYNRIYMLARSICMVMYGHCSSSDTGKYSIPLNMEIYMSPSYYNSEDCIEFVENKLKQISNEISHNKLVELNDLVKKLKQIKQERRKIDPEYRFNPIDLTPLIELKTIIFTFETITNEFIKNNGFSKYENSIRNSKSLYSFMKLVDMKIKGISYRGNINIDEISTAFNEGNFELAEQLASENNFRLFDIIMNKKSQFKFSSNCIQHFISNHPIECFEMCYCYFPNEFDQLFPLNFESASPSFKNNKIIQHYYKDKSNQIDDNSNKINDNSNLINDNSNTINPINDNSNQISDSLDDLIEKEFIELITSSRNDVLNNLDDFIYKIDPFRINEIVLDYFNDIDIEITKCLLDYTNYSIPDEETMQFDQQIIRILLSNDADKESIIHKLIVLNKIQYISKFIDSAEHRDDMVIKAYKQLTNSQIETFMYSFKDCQYIFELIASKIIDSIPFLLTICPNSLKQTLTAFNEFPDSIKMNSSLVEKQSITESICNDIKSTKKSTILRNINRDQLSLLNGEAILKALFDFCDDFTDYINGCMSISPLFESSGPYFNELGSKRISNDLLQINVDSNESELNTVLNVKSMVKFESMFQLDKSTLLHIFDNFLSEYPYLHSKIPYSCKNLIDILFKFDYDQIAYELSNEFVDHLLFTKLRVKTMLDLYQFNSAFELLDNHKEIFYPMDEFYLCPYLYNQIFDISKLLVRSETVDQIYLNLVERSKSSSIDSSFVSGCLGFCKYNLSKENYLKMVVRYNDVNNAIEDFRSFVCTSQDNELKNNLFASIARSSIEYNKFDQLRKAMQKNPKLSVYAEKLPIDL